MLYTDDSRRTERTRFPMLRQQEVAGTGMPNLSLADFVAPRASRVPDYLGAFAVTAGLGVTELVRKHERDHDDYGAIIVKALADRLAEAFAERLHEQAREDWGYAKGEGLSKPDLLAGEVPRHPPGVRLPGVPGPLGEAAAVRPARRRGGRHRP